MNVELTSLKSAGTTKATPNAYSSVSTNRCHSIATYWICDCLLSKSYLHTRTLASLDKQLVGVDTIDGIDHLPH